MARFEYFDLTLDNNIEKITIFALLEKHGTLVHVNKLNAVR